LITALLTDTIRCVLDSCRNSRLQTQSSVKYRWNPCVH